MPGAIVAVCFSLVVLAQAAVPSRPIVVGDPIVDDDIAQVRRLAVDTGVGAPWLLSSSAWTQVGGERIVVAHGEATRTTATIRRGKTVRLTAGRSPSVDMHPRRWNVQTRLGDPFGKWAQVAVPGRGFNDVSSPLDANVPFTVAGDIRDSDLIEIVRLVRAESGRAPVTAVSEDGAGGVRYEVTVTEALLSGRGFTVARMDGGWRIVRRTHWIV